MDERLAARRVHGARVARLGTVTRMGVPHLVPCCLVLSRGLDGDRPPTGRDRPALRGHVVYSAVDAKPKRSLDLRRIRNILANPAASLLVDHYEEDWAALWWVRLDGVGRVVDAGAEAERAREALTAKYPQYREIALPGPVLALDVQSWTARP